MAHTVDHTSKFFSDVQSVELVAQLDKERMPKHVAVIMDGNGRWAKLRKKPRIAGHKAGAAMVKDLIAASIELDLEYLTIYSFSSENWTRPAEEVNGLMSLFVEVLTRELANLQANNVRVLVIGALDDIPLKTKRAFDDCIQATAANTGLTLVVAINYGARQDIVRAIKSIAERVDLGALQVEDINENLVSSSLSTAGVPDPDLLIRTSGEMRISNFLLWEIAYTELVVTSTLWPDYGRQEFLKSLIEYQGRQRRFGGL